MMVADALPSYEARLYVGSREGYEGEEFNRDRLLAEIREFHLSDPDNVSCLRITPTCYVVKDYIEEGWEVACINYPRFPKFSDEIRAMMCRLAGHLLVGLGQNRITIVASDITILLTRENAEQHPTVHHSHKE